MKDIEQIKADIKAANKNLARLNNELQQKVDRELLKRIIPKKDLKPGAYYKGEYRITNVGQWDGKKEVFLVIRHKFGDTYIWEAEHFEDVIETGYDGFKPFEEIGDDVDATYAEMVQNIRKNFVEEIEKVREKEKKRNELVKKLEIFIKNTHNERH